jgi:hypothetical protein
VLPVLVMLVFGTIQLGLLYRGRATLNYATMLAARAGALHNGDMGEMRGALARGLLPMFATSASPAGYEEGRLTAEAETAGSLATIEVLNPTPAAFSDFGRPREDGGSGSELPNDTLSYRTSGEGAASKISIQDANILHVRVTYCFRLIVPVIDRMLNFMLNTAAPDAAVPGLRNPFGIGAAASSAPCGATLSGGPRIQIRSEAMVRMQSPFYQANLSSPGSSGPGTPPGGGGPGGGGTPPGSIPPGGAPVPGPTEDPDNPGSPTDPGGTCTGDSCPVCSNPSGDPPPPQDPQSGKPTPPDRNPTTNQNQ